MLLVSYVPTLGITEKVVSYLNIAASYKFCILNVTVYITIAACVPEIYIF